MHYFVEPLSDEWVQAVMVVMDAKLLITMPRALRDSLGTHSAGPGETNAARKRGALWS